jgi:hypothetical protein
VPQTARVLWPPHRGRVRLNFNWDAINGDSVVDVSASEYHRPETSPESAYRLIGDAPIRVGSIAPHSNPGGVTFVVEVDWDDPLPIATDITVMDPPVVREPS